MAIKPTEPITKPATDEKVFDELWLKSFTLRCQSIDKTRANAVLCPMNSTTGEIDHDTSFNVKLNDILKVAEENADIKRAMDYLFDAIETYAKDQNII